MAYLDDLLQQQQQTQQALKLYEFAITNCEADRQKALQRRTQIENINNDLKRGFDSDVREINKKINSVVDNIEDGIKGGKISTDITDSVEQFEEKYDDSDRYLSSAIGQMDAEYNALTTYINEKSREIANYQNSVSQCQAKLGSLAVQISTEKKRIEQEIRAAEEARRREEAMKTNNSSKTQAKTQKSTSRKSSTSKSRKKG